MEYEREAGVAYCRGALANVSRSFALTIPMIDCELRDKITVSYVVARVLDTLEDSPIPMEMKKKLMDEWINLLSTDTSGNISQDMKVIYPRLAAIASTGSRYVADAAYSELMKNSFKVYAAATNFDCNFASSQHRWFREMKEGMKKYLTKRIVSFKDFDEYAYYVAGTVGGFLTDLVCEGAESEAQKTVLKSTFRDFGLLLQKVNIIRDFREDVIAQKHFWPEDALQGMNGNEMLLQKNIKKSMKSLGMMLSDAESHKEKARLYIDSIPSRFSGYRMFALVNFHMAIRTLDLMKGNRDVFLSQTPLKIGRKNVEEILKHSEMERMARR